MIRNDFFVAWLVVITLLLVVIMGVTVFFVWRSGLLSGDVPVVVSTSEGELTPEITPGPTQLDSNSPNAFTVRLHYMDPRQQLLVAEDRSLAGSSHMPGRINSVLEALRQPSANPQLAPAVPPEIQFRTVFFEPETTSVYIDLVSLPETWDDAHWIEVSLCLQAIVHTLSGMQSDFRHIRFLVEGKETDLTPGGLVLTEPILPSMDWIAANGPS